VIRIVSDTLSKNSGEDLRRGTASEVHELGHAAGPAAGRLVPMQDNEPFPEEVKKLPPLDLVFVKRRSGIPPRPTQTAACRRPRSSAQRRIPSRSVVVVAWLMNTSWSLTVATNSNGSARIRFRP
jgi:hypothetical protein